MILERGGLETLLEMAVSGKIQVHNEIPKEEVEVGPLVANGILYIAPDLSIYTKRNVSHQI